MSRARWSSSRGDSPFRGEKEQSWSRGVRKKEERAEGGGCARQVPRRCRSPTFRRSRKGVATRVCFRFDDEWAHVEVRKGKERFRI